MDQLNISTYTNRSVTLPMSHLWINGSSDRDRGIGMARLQKEMRLVREMKVVQFDGEICAPLKNTVN